MKRIAIYDRYKLDNGEIPELHGIMIVDCKRKIADRENELVGEFYDECSELVSLKDRPEYTKLYDMCMNGEVDELYVTSLSRISRRMSWITQMCRDMHECGIKVTFMNEEVTSEQLLNSPVMKGIGDAIEQKMGM